MTDNKTNTVLVTGGRGFVGLATAKLLQRAGYRVVSLDRSAVASGNEAVREEVECDIRDCGRLREIFEAETIQGIIHLAAVLPTAAQREPQLATEVNVLGSINLLEMARQYGVPRFVFGSSLSVYGTWPEEKVVSEMDRAAPEDVYGAAKVYVERLGEAYRQKYGLGFVSLRIGRVVGPGAQSATSAWRSEIFECIRAGGSTDIAIPYAEQERILLVHVEDVARMLAILLGHPRPAYGVYNAPCESVIVGELKRVVERANPGVRVKLSGQAVVGNPRQVDWSRLAGEFGVEVVPVFEQLARAASRGHTAPDLRGESSGKQ